MSQNKWNSPEYSPEQLIGETSWLRAIFIFGRYSRCLANRSQYTFQSILAVPVMDNIKSSFDIH